MVTVKKTKFERVKELVEQGKSTREIVEETEVTKSTAEYYVWMINSGFDYPTGYRDHLAKQRINPETGEPFKSDYELQDYRIRQRVNPETGQKFVSMFEHNEYLARQRGYKNLQQSRMAFRGLKRPIDLLDHDTQNMGYDGFNCYNKIRKIVNEPEQEFIGEQISRKKLRQRVENGSAHLPREFVSHYDEERIREIWGAIDSLFESGAISAKAKEILERIYRDGQTLEEIGEVFYYTRQNIQSTESRTLEKIKGFFWKS